MKHFARMFLVVFATVSAALAVGPEDTVVVVNADSWASTCVANEYIRLREIPATHVVYLAGLPSFERMSVQGFRDQILAPLRAILAERGLTDQVDTVLYSADFPTAIDTSADGAGRKLPTNITRQAAINGLTYLYRLVEAKDVGYLDLQSNEYARRVGSDNGTAAWSDADRQQYAEAMDKLHDLWSRRRREKADADPKAIDQPAPAAPSDQGIVSEVLASLEALDQRHAGNADLLYQKVRVLALLERPDDAIVALRAAVKAGWWNYASALRDDRLRILRERADFQQLIEEVKQKPIEVRPAAAFSPAATGTPTGAESTSPGPRYFLSTVLAFTSGRGNSVAEALDCLRRSVAADGTRPAGTIYYLENSDIRSTTRQWGFRRAVELLSEAGVRAAIESGVLPGQKPDIAGLMVGSAAFQWEQCGSTILPGAICEHLTSCGGMLHEGDSQTPLTEFLRHGAAGASGTVTEPYAIQAKFPTPFLHWYYVQGATLAEAFYQSVAGPYQLLVIGDALCRPWARPVKFALDGATAGAVLSGEARITPCAEAIDQPRPVEYAFHLDGRRIGTIRPGDAFRLDTRPFADGWHELLVVARAGDALASRGAVRMPIVIKSLVVCPVRVY